MISPENSSTNAHEVVAVAGMLAGALSPKPSKKPTAQIWILLRRYLTVFSRAKYAVDEPAQPPPRSRTDRSLHKRTKDSESSIHDDIWTCLNVRPSMLASINIWIFTFFGLNLDTKRRYTIAIYTAVDGRTLRLYSDSTPLELLIDVWYVCTYTKLSLARMALKWRLARRNWKTSQMAPCDVMLPHNMGITPVSVHIRWKETMIHVCVDWFGIITLFRYIMGCLFGAQVWAETQYQVDCWYIEDKLEQSSESYIREKV